MSVLPAALVIIALFNLARGDENAFAERLTSHMNLDGPTASLVDDLFGTTANNLLAASVTIVIGFLVWVCPSGSCTRTSTRAPGASSGLGGRPGAVHDLVLRLQGGLSR